MVHIYLLLDLRLFLLVGLHPAFRQGGEDDGRQSVVLSPM